jgi:hypothetical protein
MNREDLTPTPINRKQYETPRVTEYGDICEITRATSNMGATDNAVNGSRNSI